jgi:hypothetical protein
VAISPHPPTGRPVRLLLHSQFGLGVSCEVSRFDHTGWEVFYKSRDPEIRYGALSLPSSCSSVLPEPLYDTRDIRSFFIIYKGHGRKRHLPRNNPSVAMPCPPKPHTLGHDGGVFMPQHKPSTSRALHRKCHSERGGACQKKTHHTVRSTRSHALAVPAIPPIE